MITSSSTSRRKEGRGKNKMGNSDAKGASDECAESSKNNEVEVDVKGSDSDENEEEDKGEEDDEVTEEDEGTEDRMERRSLEEGTRKRTRVQKTPIGPEAPAERRGAPFVLAVATKASRAKHTEAAADASMQKQQRVLGNAAWSKNAPQESAETGSVSGKRRAERHLRGRAEVEEIEKVVEGEEVEGDEEEEADDIGDAGSPRGKMKSPAATAGAGPPCSECGGAGEGRCSGCIGGPRGRVFCEECFAEAHEGSVGGAHALALLHAPVATTLLGQAARKRHRSGERDSASPGARASAGRGAPQAAAGPAEGSAEAPSPPTTSTASSSGGGLAAPAAANGLAANGLPAEEGRDRTLVVDAAQALADCRRFEARRLAKRARLLQPPPLVAAPPGGAGGEPAGGGAPQGGGNGPDDSGPAGEAAAQRVLERVLRKGDFGDMEVWGRGAALA